MFWKNAMPDLVFLRNIVLNCWKWMKNNFQPVFIAGKEPQAPLQCHSQLLFDNSLLATIPLSNNQMMSSKFLLGDGD